MNKTEKKLRTFLNKGVICNVTAQKYLEKWFEELKSQDKDEQEIKQGLSDLTEDLLNEKEEIVEVIWKDATTLPGTSDYRDLQENGLLNARTIGYLVYEDEERITVCGFLFPDDKTSLKDSEQRTAFRDAHMIPKAWIKSIKILETNWDRTKKFKEKNQWLNFNRNFANYGQGEGQ